MRPIQPEGHDDPDDEVARVRGEEGTEWITSDQGVEAKR